MVIADIASRFAVVPVYDAVTFNLVLVALSPWIGLLTHKQDDQAMHLNAIWTTNSFINTGRWTKQNVHAKNARPNIESIDKHVVFASLFHAKLPPAVAMRSLLPRSRPKYIMQAVVVLFGFK